LTYRLTKSRNGFYFSLGSFGPWRLSRKIWLWDSTQICVKDANLQTQIWDHET